MRRVIIVVADTRITKETDEQSPLGDDFVNDRFFCSVDKCPELSRRMIRLLSMQKRKKEACVVFERPKI
jgi:hypothetical protein